MTRRIMVDMSATLLHHGHIRLLEKAADLGDVIVGLTSDEEVLKHKGYEPELSFSERREVLLAIRWVTAVVDTPWLINAAVLDEHDVDLLVHGDDNVNDIPSNRLVILPRTEEISSTELRHRALKSLRQLKEIEE